MPKLALHQLDAKFAYPQWLDPPHFRCVICEQIGPREFIFDMQCPGSSATPYREPEQVALF